MTIVSQRTNVAVPTTPPTHYYPNQTGDAIPAGGVSWTLTIDSSGYPNGSSADLAIEYEYNGVWQEDVSVGGFTLGSYTGKLGTTTINTLASSIGVNANPYPSHGRIRIDRIDAGTIASITLSIV